MATNDPVFSGSTSATDVASAFPSAIKGKTILVTGINIKGIGYTTAAALAAHSPKNVILASRTKAKIQEVIDDLRPKYGDVKYIPLELDLSSQKAVHKAASEILSNPEISQIDILINNAAVMDIRDRQLTPDGIELQFGTNHIGHFLFTNLILPKILVASKTNPKGATRIVSVASSGSWFGPVRFSDPNFDKPHESLPKSEQPNYEAIAAHRGQVDPKSTYDPKASYGQSKSANILFALGLTARLYEKHGILSYALHPGIIATELARHLNKEEWNELAGKIRPYLKTPDQGAATTLVAALDPRLAPAAEDGSGVYLDDGNIAQAPAWAQDSQLAERLWRLSEELVGDKFGY